MRRTTALMGIYSADTKNGESLRFELCKGGYFSNKDKYGLKVVGKTSQNTLSGKNLLDVNIFANVTHPTIGIKIDNSKLILTAKSDITETITIAISDITNLLNIGETYIFDCDYISNFGKANMDIIDAETNIRKSVLSLGASFTAQSNTIYKLKFYLNDAGYSILKDQQIVYDKIGLYKTTNGTVPEYEPYCGGIPSPNPNYPQAIKCVKQGTKIICGNEITLPCDLYEGDIWFPMNGRVERHNGIIESYNGEALPENYISTTGQLSLGAKVVYPLSAPVIENYSPQPIFAHQGTVNVTQVPEDLHADLSATLLTLKE